jgi:CII-binding regulator of phage lambda lysogenization HflD
MNEELRVTQAENNTLKIQLHEIMHKMKLQEKWHKQETMELYENLICVRKENEQLVLEIILIEQKFRQTNKEAKKLREEISFLQQKMQPCDMPVKTEILKMAGSRKAVVSLRSKQVDVC